MILHRTGAAGLAPMGWRPIGRHLVTAALIVTAVGCWVGSGRAEVVLPERRVTARREVNGDPSLAALQAHVAGAWEAAGDSSGIEVDVSLDGGLSWTLGTRLVAAAPRRGISMPTALFLSPNNELHLATDDRGVLYHRGSGFTPIVWDPLKVVLGVYNVDLLGYELHSIGANPALGHVYICSTENTEDADWSSTALFSRSLDNGGTWSFPLRLSSIYSKGSNMVVGPDGSIHAAWVDYSLSQAVVRRSLDRGSTFEPPVLAGDMLDNLDVLPLGWQVPRTPYRFYPWFRDFFYAPNFPALAVDRSAGPTRGNLYLT